jgi:hypothetical protein
MPPLDDDVPPDEDELLDPSPPLLDALDPPSGTFPTEAKR